MPEIVTIDTNVILDIIYAKRKRHVKADSFYRNFKNYELFITRVVKEEGYRINYESVSLLAPRLANYISKANWDAKKPFERKNELEKLKEKISVDKDITNKQRTEFVTETLEELTPILLNRDAHGAKEMAENLAGARASTFSKQVEARFKVVYALSADDDFDNYTRRSLDHVFSQHNRHDLNDRDILKELIILAKYGDTYRKRYDRITLYTCDEPFYRKYRRYKEGPYFPEPDDKIFNDKIRSALDAIELKVPY